MRAADRLLTGSDRQRSGAALLASLALHGGALAAALAGLIGSGVAPGQGEPQAIAIVFVPGPPAPAPSMAAEAEPTREAEAAAPLETAPPPMVEERIAADEAVEPPLVDAAAAETVEQPALPEPEQVANAVEPPPGPPRENPAPPPPDAVRQAALPLPPPPPATPPAARPSAPPRRTAQTAELRSMPSAPARAGDSPAAGLPEAEGPPAPPVQPGPILVSHPGFRRPPVPPSYPPQAIARGIEGTVLVRVLIGPDGETIEVRVHRSSGAVLLDRAALAAVQGWEFRPATVGGRAAPAWVEVPVRFRLD
jgi:protein TonB